MAKRPRLVNLAEARARLSALVEAAHAGQVIILARAGKPRARLVPLEADTRPLAHDTAEHRSLRVAGQGRGRFTMAADFDAPLPEGVQAAFERRKPRVA